MEQASYVNKFNIAVNIAGQEVQLKFYQDQPIWNEIDGNITEIGTTDTCRLVMSLIMAKRLVEVLSKCISDSENSNPKE